MEKKYKILSIVLGIIIICLICYIIINNNKKEEVKCKNMICDCTNTLQEQSVKTEAKQEEKKKKEIQKDSDGNRIIEDYYNSDKVGHSDNEFVGLYSVKKDIIQPESWTKYKANFYLYLNDDGTFVYDISAYVGYDYYGNYIVEEDQIILNFLFKGGHQPIFEPYFHTSILEIESTNVLIDTNIVEYSENIGTKEVTLERLDDQNRINKYKNEMRDVLENFLYTNEPMI